MEASVIYNLIKDMKNHHFSCVLWITQTRLVQCVRKWHKNVHTRRQGSSRVISPLPLHFPSLQFETSLLGMVCQLPTGNNFALLRFVDCAQSCPSLLQPDGLQPRAPMPMEFSKQESWSGVPFPPPGSPPNPGMESASLASPALAGGFFTTGATWEATKSLNFIA